MLSSSSPSLSFGFSYGVIGNPVAMAFVFVFTGMFGLMFASAFRASKSLALPIGLHLGWNIVTNLVFSAGPLGATLLVAANGAQRIQAQGGLGLLCKLLLPTAMALGACWYLGYLIHG